MKKYLILPLSILWMTNIYSINLLHLITTKGFFNPVLNPKKLQKIMNKKNGGRVELDQELNLALFTYIMRGFQYSYDLDKKNTIFTPKKSQQAVYRLLSKKIFGELQRRCGEAQFKLTHLGDKHNQGDRIIFSLPKTKYDTTECRKILEAIMQNAYNNNNDNNQNQNNTDTDL